MANPFNYQEFADNKLIVLDVRCRDNAGRILNVEMQVWIIRGLLERMVYNCDIDTLTTRLAALQQRLRDRQV